MESKPVPPDTLPKYMTEGLDKQDDKTLRDVIAHCEALLEYREEQEPEIPDDAERVEDEDEDGKGVVVKKKVTCGKDSCHCADGEKHGPYLYRYYWDGETKCDYVGKP